MDRETRELICRVLSDIKGSLSHDAAFLWLLAEESESVGVAEWSRRWRWDRKKVRVFINNYNNHSAGAAGSPSSGTPIAQTQQSDINENEYENELMAMAWAETRRRQAAGCIIRNPAAYAAGVARQIRRRGGLTPQEQERFVTPRLTQQPRSDEACMRELRERLAAGNNSNPAVARNHITAIMTHLRTRSSLHV